ncbi:hypothetical protein COW36_10590 [bacterium (Candidatus Blackallbacteria) CG17_big_fil_post_rev_8_21_14_2_50_48_46]|uniref:DNA-binding response regulator n=1 Tax=bacterium (Candidatus Blackallbacteria) CG17_big_fil_post_rev_8_21_14_2_50_48_46 TaxID=2014261 RepID=A0A2M7G548_9BACT|nr:MAG: hypothetical protein COW64_20365 [bacterium (Candidatus Blackallbacteria) CG18_big_fil_WC_8_21_14_2_50_49_26]PIW17076.1 MAG: hypothetical protein COW36_10590 [bacterium (Candidatus Blackallbacteria) CG17_big_fil_post_rev_8_21_14_2_50_48_46]PIW47689.1 MAG: hypothetical protein COW20_11630 [bacterium (Candidatus Blackallbacteria) CG13_big_fil_rev_8_21_14_2_50_49_14]
MSIKKTAAQKIPAKILLIDDDPILCQVFQDMFVTEPWKIETALNGAQGLAKAAQNTPDIAICDIMLPDISGMEVCRMLKKKHPQMQVLFLSGLDATTEKVIGLELGAEDYITKPFGMRELRARLRAAVRRKGKYFPELTAFAPPQAPIKRKLYAAGELVFNTQTREVSVRNKILHLTQREFEIFKILALSPDKIFTRLDLTDLLKNKNINERTIDAQIRRLRDKIKSEDLPQYIQTVRGIGYRFHPGR